MNILEARRVTKRFGGLTAVKEVDFDVPEKKIASLIGPNGAGKTTFFNCITGFYAHEEGEISLEGIPLTGLRPDQIVKLGIARTYQTIRLFKQMTAIENILVGQHPRLHANAVGAILRLPSERDEEERALTRSIELLDFVGLRGRGDEISSNLAYGDQRRLEVARALASDPRLLLLDEPTAGMNPRETAEMMAFIQRLRDELDLTIILIEHDMKVVMGVSDRVSVLDYGEKIAEGTPAEVQRDPRVIEAYLGQEA